ncbi:MAG: hypothetical protein KTU85_07075 [Acidimicrobiia bacterium]|nr:hypothetical protein [Acidimicrobiia bacterium]
MNIRKGHDWGEPADIPANACFVNNDAEANAVISTARRAGRSTPPLCLLGGDLARTVGVHNNAARLRAGEGSHLRIDLGEALLDGRIYYFVAHLVARHSWWRGPLLVAANAAFIGNFNVAPKAHPGDGLLEIIEANPTLSERLKARARLPSGTHLPHPQIKLRRSKATQLELARPTPIRVDGIDVSAATRLSIRVEAAALDIWV